MVSCQGSPERGSGPPTFSHERLVWYVLLNLYYADCLIEASLYRIAPNISKMTG